MPASHHDSSWSGETGAFGKTITVLASPQSMVGTGSLIIDIDHTGSRFESWAAAVNNAWPQTPNITDPGEDADFGEMVMVVAYALNDMLLAGGDPFDGQAFMEALKAMCMMCIT